MTACSRVMASTSGKAAACRSRKRRNRNLARYDFPMFVKLNLCPVHQGEHLLGIGC